MAMIFAAIAAGTTVITLAMPLLSGDALEKRMAAVATETVYAHFSSKTGLLQRAMEYELRAIGLTTPVMTVLVNDRTRMPDRRLILASPSTTSVITSGRRDIAVRLGARGDHAGACSSTEP